MISDARTRRTRATRRRDVWLTYANGLLWAIGNGLVPTFLVGYLALELGAGSAAVAWLVAAPRFAGVLRVLAPRLLEFGGSVGLSRKSLCLSGYLASGVVLSGVPLATYGADESNMALRITLLAIAWCVYHLLEYAATVYLWSWLGDLYPRPLRGRLLGRRERCLTLGRFIGIGASIGLAAGWQFLKGEPDVRTPLWLSAAAGNVLMLAAIVPLVFTTALASRPSAKPIAVWRTLASALAETPYRRLLVYHGWLAFANGLTGTAHNVFPRAIGVSYASMQSYKAMMWLGQSAVAPGAGRFVERWGAKRVMLPAQLLVATGPLWFFFASESQPWWVAVAYVMWIFYAPINVGLDTLKLGLANDRNNAPYVAVFHAVGDFLNGVTVLLGGLLYQTLAPGDALAMNVYTGLFLTGFALRTLAAAFLWRVNEPQPDQRATMEA